jgi:hypothetical protein
MAPGRATAHQRNSSRMNRQDAMKLILGRLTFASAKQLPFSGSS